MARQEGMDGFDRMVAIKRILPHLLDDKSFVRMFQDEARLAARLSHPNVVHIYDFGKVEEHFFIAMELMHAVHAGDLIRLAADTKIPPTLVARIGANACAGLHYAHNRKDNQGKPLKLVHRDVSPPNLLISYDGVVKLVDFGIAKAVSSIEQTRPGVVKGKYAFMSPEQTMGHALDGHSDVFSLGLVLWELLAGRNAVTRDDQILAMKTIRDGRVPAITTVRKDVPTKLVSALHNALHKSPKKRSDARQFGKELEAFIKSSNEIATNMELGAWLTEHIPPQAELVADDSSEGTKRATVATSLHSLEEEEPEELVFGRPLLDPEDEADVTKLVAVVNVDDLPSVKGDLTGDDRPAKRAPEDDADSVVIARDLISQEAREVARRTDAAAVRDSESNEDSLGDEMNGEETGEHTSVDDELPAAITHEMTGVSTKDAATVVGHGFATASTGLGEMDEPTNDLEPPTEEDIAEEDPTVEDYRPVGAAARSAVSDYDLQPQATGKLVAQSVRMQRQSPYSFAKMAPWIAGGVAILALIVASTFSGDAKSDKPAVKTIERQPIVFDPDEAAAYRRDGGTGLPPIVVTPLPDGGQAPIPKIAPKELAPSEVIEPEPGKRSRRGRSKSAKNIGYVAVTSNASSEVFLKGAKIGKTPLQDLKLKEGRYKLKFVAKGHPPIIKEVQIRARQTTRFQVDFGP